MADTASPERRAHYERIAGKGPKRGLTLTEIAAELSMTAAGFSAWLRRTGINCRIPGSKRYDLKALNEGLDRLMGTGARGPERELTPYEAWRAKRDEGGPETC